MSDLHGKLPKPWQDIADAAGILRAHNHMGLADRLLRHAEALVEQPAQQDGETIVQTFIGLPKRKLCELLAAGWQINGVCFQRTEEDGAVRRGAATTGGMVLWWNQDQPAQRQEPVATTLASHVSGEVGYCKFHVALPNGTLLYTSPQPAQQEPVGKVVDCDSLGTPIVNWKTKSIAFGTMLYTSPPASKPWVGLTEEDHEQAVNVCLHVGVEGLAFWLEDKLKEKNS